MKIGIVNDMEIAVELLKRSLATEEEVEIIWVAYNGQQAVNYCIQEVPDLILMDLVMPVMDGVEATYKIMQSTPCPILVVTVSIGENAAKVFEAMGKGALDAVKTPYFGEDGSIKGAEDLLKKIKIISRLNDHHYKLSTDSYEKIEEEKDPEAFPGIVAIGASTGGPRALSTILKELSEPFPLSVIMIQHIDEEFAANMAMWLRDETGKEVQVACEGEKIQPGKFYLAGKNDHLTLTKGRRFHYSKEPQESFYRPSVDVFFHSLSNLYGGLEKNIAILLTGMGEDGAEGLKQLRGNGWHTIAQDENSCVVFGMPKAAIKREAIEEILSLDGIIKRLKEL